ncbi:MAG TPA: lysophospholipid acyltransferase family protein [Gemmatimonadaceae bacterium]
MRALLAYPTMFVMTLLLGIPVIVVSLMRVRIDPDSLLGRAPRLWGRTVLRAAGVRLALHGTEHIAPPGQARVYVSNHVSWFEIFGLAAILPRCRFVAKKEIAALPIFGRAAGEVAAIFIDRGNRKAAFDSYADAAGKMKGGTSVVVFPEGTRGYSYALRPFKKGPFVLAIAAQAPVVPVVSRGTREIQAKGQVAIHSGVCELTFLEPIPTAGMTYDDRERLMNIVWHRMAAELERAGARGDEHTEAGRQPSAGALPHEP